MKKILISLLLTIATMQTTHAQGFSYNGVTHDVIIDVRTTEEFKAGHIEGAINIPYDEIEDGIKKLQHINSNTRILVYCRSGRRSGIALDTLTQEGFHQVTNGGGFSTLKGQVTHCNTYQC